MTKSNLESVTIHESRTLVVEDVAEDGTFEVLLIDEGKGSSGTYTRELFEKSYHAFDEALSFKNHPGMFEGPESRDFTMLAGQIVGSVYVKENPKTGKAGIYGRYLPDPEYADKIERYKNKLGLSIYADGEGYFDEDGEFVVDYFNEHWPYTSVDIVIAAGRGGKLTAESLRKMYPESNRLGETKEDEETMKPEDVMKAIEALTAQVQSLVAKSEAEKAEGAQVEADQKAVEEALSAYDAQVQAIAEADLLPVQADRLRKEALAGRDVSEMIVEAKALYGEMKAALTESQNDAGGRVVEGATGSKFGAWA